ncbi:high mobility group box domain-containing protein, partial [Mycena filopes]
YIRRPRNAFFIFRSDFVLETRAGTEQSLQQQNLSRAAAQVWSKMSQDERRPFYERAENEKQDHALRYPNYRFQPKRGK